MRPLRRLNFIARTIFTAPALFLLFSAVVSSQPNVHREWQDQWDNARSGDTLHIAVGEFDLENPLFLRGKQNIYIKGAGKDKTILRFDQDSFPGAGIYIEDCENIRLEAFSVYNNSGDCISARGTFNIQFLFIRAGSVLSNEVMRWHGISASQSQRVLFYECEAHGKSGAGFRVSECEQVVVRKCNAEANGVGIEIENTSYADAIGNELQGNACGLLNLNLPELDKKSGGDLKLYDNKIYSNNRAPHPSAPIISQIPGGTGISIIAASDIKIYQNEISNNQSISIGVLSYYSFNHDTAMPKYHPYSVRISIHDNQLSREQQRPSKGTELGKVLSSKFGKKVPHIIYDGIRDETYFSPTTGRLLPEYEICIYNNSEETFTNLDAGNDFKNLSDDLSLFRCN